MRHQRFRQKTRPRQTKQFQLIQLGFTLVELMVVVAIVALLSVIALPNFSGQAAKAKMTEAKSLASAALKQAAAEFAEAGPSGVTNKWASQQCPATTQYFRFICDGSAGTMPRVYARGLAASGLGSTENLLQAEVDLDPLNKDTGRLGVIQMCGTMPGLPKCNPGG